MTSTPTKARHVVTLFAVALAVITYVDRVAIYVSLLVHQRGSRPFTIQMGWALAAFAWAYALFEIPGGWLGDQDRPAPRADADRPLVVAVHRGDRLGLERDFPDRRSAALFGAGEAGAFPT